MSKSTWETLILKNPGLKALTVMSKINSSELEITLSITTTSTSCSSLLVASKNPRMNPVINSDDITNAR